jgi:salicylate hydroxylase
MTAPKATYAIIGGGIAGLTLGIALHKRGISVTIYEAAAHFGEIGAGVAFTRNAVEAMSICDQGVFEAFDKVVTKNQWEDKENVWFDFLDGMDNETRGYQKELFTSRSAVGANGVHRAAFLDEMVKLVKSDNIARFGKRLESIEEREDGKLEMRFKDGSTAVANAIIGCDGIKSKVRKIMVGEKSEMAGHTYTHKYAYRGLIEMGKAVEAVGEERAKNAVLWVSDLVSQKNRYTNMLVLDGQRPPCPHLPCQPWRNTQSRSLRHNPQRLARLLQVHPPRQARRSHPRLRRLRS